MNDAGGLLPGTLDLLILKAVSLGTLHGYGVLLRIQQISGGALQIQQGALYPALYRLEQQGLIDSEWGTSDNNRRAKFYRLTPAGRARLGEEAASWNRLADAMAMALQDDAQGDLRMRRTVGARPIRVAGAAASGSARSGDARRDALPHRHGGRAARCATQGLDPREARRLAHVRVRRRREVQGGGRGTRAGCSGSTQSGARRPPRRPHARQASRADARRRIRDGGGHRASARRPSKSSPRCSTPRSRSKRASASSPCSTRRRSRGAPSAGCCTTSSPGARSSGRSSSWAHFARAQHNLVSERPPPEPIKVAEITASGFAVARTPPLARPIPAAC